MPLQHRQAHPGRTTSKSEKVDLKDRAPILRTNQHELPLAHQIHYGRLLSGAVALVALGLIANLFVTNSNMQWEVVRQYLFGPQILLGLYRTLELTVLAMAIGIVLGTALALMRLSSNPVLSTASLLFVGFFRGTPLLVQIIFWFNLSLLIPTVSLGIPFGPTFVSVETNSLITPFLASLLALGLNEAAYMSEIVRAGITSVDPGQFEAAQTIGLSRRATVNRVVLPQAMRVIIPPTGNQVIGMLKSTALVSAIAYPELLYSAQLIYSRTYETIPLLIVVSVWYLVASTILSYFQRHLEKHFSRGRRPIPRGGPRRPNGDRRQPAAKLNSALDLGGDSR